MPNDFIHDASMRMDKIINKPIRSEKDDKKLGKLIDWMTEDLTKNIPDSYEEAVRKSNYKGTH